MNPTYRHTQRGMLLVYILGASFGFAVIAIVMAKAPWAFVLYFVIVYALILASFASLTVEVAEGKLRWWFGIGVFRGSVALADITSAEVVRNPWYYSWGIHMTPDGWIYNISGFEAIRVTRTNGKIFRLGTDEPQKLLNILKEAGVSGA